MFRVNAEPLNTFKYVVDQLIPQLKNPDPKSLKISNRPNGEKELVKNITERSIDDLGFKHGEMLFLDYDYINILKDESQISGIESNFVKQLEVDNVLEKQSGFIKRQKTNLCKHGDQGMCEYCSPLPPWDGKYLEENGIKHKSFHAHLKELNFETNKETSGSYIPPLKPQSFEVKKNCSGGHKPWPEGICSKCQPSAITLKPQEFRMVDHVEFSTSGIVEQFIEAWRQTGVQRFGYLYGRYEQYDAVPLGIKAVVEAIYEPPQMDENDGISLTLPWKEKERVDRVASLCGLTTVGMIFTDLIDSGNSDGSVVCKRHKDSYFLSSVEVLLAAKEQIKHPNYTSHSSTGIFSSKFVTCVVTGNLNYEIEVNCYQVSESAEALVKADLICGSTHPSMVYIQSKNEKRYVPDIYYQKKNQYGIVVKEHATPAFPDDYLLVTLSHGFPQQSKPLFISPKKFPIENRQFIGVSQDYKQLQSHLSLGHLDDESMIKVMKILSDFHLLMYLTSLDVLSPEEERLLIKTATKHDVNECYELFESPGWETLTTIMSYQ